MNRKGLASLALALSMTFTLTIPAYAYNNENLIPQQKSYTAPFPDLTQDWYKSAVQTCYEAGLMEGSGRKFSPAGTLSYAEVITIAARLHQLTHGGSGQLPAPEQGQKWYQGAVNYLTEALVDGDSALQAEVLTELQYLADPYNDEIYMTYTDPCPRLHFVYFLAAALPDSALPDINHLSENDLPGAGSVEQTVLSFYNAGILTGTDPYGTFNGKRSLTRAEAAAILGRIIDPQERISGFTPASFSASEAFLSLAPDTPLMQVNDTTVTADLYLHWLDDTITWYLNDSSAPRTVFAEEYQDFLKEYGAEDDFSASSFDDYLEEKYGIFVLNPNWTAQQGKSGQTLAQRLMPIAERNVIENACILNHEKDYPLDAAEQARVDAVPSDTDPAAYGFTTATAKSDLQMRIIYDHMFKKLTPSSAELDRLLASQNCAYGMMLSLSRSASDQESRSEAERLRQEMQQHLKETDYITYLMQTYSQIDYGPASFALDDLSQDHQRTIKALAAGQVSPVLTEDDSYLIFYKTEPDNDALILYEITEGQCNALLSDWTDAAVVTTADAYRQIDPNLLFSRISK